MTSMAKVLDHVGRHYNLAPVTIVRGGRSADALTFRAVSAYLARECLGLSTVQTARAVGIRDHTTITYALKHAVSAVDKGDELGQAASKLAREFLSKIDEDVSELVADLDDIAEDSNAGVSIADIAEWYGISLAEAYSLAQIAVVTGKVHPKVDKKTRRICKIAHLPL